MNRDEVELTQRFAVPLGFRGLARDAVVRDLVAGLTVWAVLVPEGLAYATIAGVPPVVGLYAAPAALVLYALFGSSRHLVVGPMAAAAALSAAAVASQTGDPGEAIVLTVVLALVVGVIATVAGLMRFGFVAAFISEPVLKGFIVGLALTIIAGQVPKLMGLHSAHGSFVERVVDLIGDLADVHGASLAVGLISLVAILGLHRFAHRAPAPLIVVTAAIVAAQLLDLEGHGVAVVGDIAAGLPDLGLPDAGWSDYTTLSAGAVGIALVGFAEGLAAAKSYAATAGYRVDPDRELLGLGAANIGAGLSSGMVVAGSLSKTAVNGAAGARSQLSGVIVGGLTVVTLLLLTGLFEDLPEPALAAVVVAAVVDLVDLSALRRLYHVHTTGLARIYGHAARADLLAAVAALSGVLVLDTLPGLFVGIAVSAVLLVYRASRPHVAIIGQLPGEERWVEVERHQDARQPPGVVVVRPESGLFYGNSDNVHAAILGAVDTAHGPVHGVVVDAGSVPTIDITAADMLAQLAVDLERRGIGLTVARDLGQVRDVLRHSDAAELAATFHPTVDAAVAAVSSAAPDGQDAR